MFIKKSTHNKVVAELQEKLRIAQEQVIVRDDEALAMKKHTNSWVRQAQTHLRDAADKTDLLMRLAKSMRNVLRDTNVQAPIYLRDYKPLLDEVDSACGVEPKVQK